MNELAPPPYDHHLHSSDEESSDALEQEIFERAALDRVWFAEEVLGFIPDGWQRELLQDMDAGHTRISIRSGHGVGKTATCAITAIHFLLFRPGSTKIVITSPSSSQLNDGLWAEILLWIDKLPEFLRSLIDVRSRRIVGLDNPENRFISLRTARIESPEALAGIHADNVLVLVDEASGVPEPVYEAAAGTLSTVGSIAILIGNPTRCRGYFYRTHTLLADHWLTKQVSCLDSPRVSAAFVEDIRRTYGEASAQWKIRILGEFAELDEDVIIPRELAESALGRDIEEYDQPVYWGIDPGRGGDATGFVARQGSKVLFTRQFHLTDLMQVVGRVHEVWEDEKEIKRPERVFVDVIGLGAGVADRLRELGLPVIDVNVSEAPSLKERYPRLRDEIWFNCRDWLETRKCSIPDDDMGRELVEELCAPLIVLNSAGKSGAESKQDMKRRGVPSPNLADALNLTFAMGGAIASGASGFQKYGDWSKPVSRRLGGVA